MGKGRDKRKKAKGTQSGQGTVKTTKKTEKNEEKQARRAEKRAEGGEDDLDALLAKFALEDKRQSTVEVVHNAPPPSARVYASFTPVSPAQKDSDILLFGGEYLDTKTDKVYVKNELYSFHTGSHTWTQYIVPNGPPPRTAHQACLHKQHLYVFGGELTSVNQEKFRHYRDMWRLDLRSHQWEQLPCKKGPAARSGHRMLVHRNKLLLFGGFHDDDKTQMYYNDLWEFDTEELRWAPVETRGPVPAPRGGCQLALHHDTLFVLGGHSVLRDGTGERDKVHNDVHALDLKTLEWSRVKLAGMAPQPRTSFGLVTHKGRAILFGGVADQAGKGDRMFSENFDEMYQFNLEPHLRRWFPISIRLPAKAKAAAAEAKSVEQQGRAAQPVEGSGRAAAAGVEVGSSPDRDSPLYHAAVRIQSRYRGYLVRKAYQTYKLGGKVSELLYSPATYGVDFSSKALLKPRARQAPLMAVVKNTLWLMGGIVEVSHTDVYLDDIWCLDLVKMDGWECVKENTEGEEAFKQESDWETDEGSDEESQ